MKGQAFTVSCAEPKNHSISPFPRVVGYPGNPRRTRFCSQFSIGPIRLVTPFFISTLISEKLMETTPGQRRCSEQVREREVFGASGMISLNPR